MEDIRLAGVFKEHPGSRQIRIFISSTFQDMKDEREELVKRVFPRLRRLCEDRGVTLHEVDLRWGITDEQSADGKVLPICLSEIDACRPFFIGMLGERYGWIPGKIQEELFEQEPWLEENLDKSVTELEILHGALNDPGSAKHAFFYFRDQAYIDTRPTIEHSFLLENPTQDEISRLGLEEAERYSQNRRLKLEILKDKIRQSGLNVRENYSNPRQFGELVLDDLTGLINSLFPAGTEPHPLDREATEHDMFAESRYRIYIGRQNYFDKLNEFVESEGLPLIISGESGIGKSALLANWAMKFRRANPDVLVIMHFIGALPYSADWASMLRRIMGEFKRWYDIQEDIPLEPAKLKSSFANWLHMTAAKGKVVLILDALNQLEDRENALDLQWLPPFIPENIRLIVSTLPGRPLDALDKRGWSKINVEPLSDEERAQLIRDYLGQHRKSLDQSRIERIIASVQTRNPLFLRTLLEELRLFGVHKHLDRAIEHYLSCEDIPSLYGKILKRLEQDYDRDWPGLVQDAMSFIWASRRGLSVAELLDLLGAAGKPLPPAQWAQFHTAVEKLLISRSGLVGFAHDYIRNAIMQRYLPGKKAQHASHLCLADYFDSRDIGPRVIDELPWQLAEADAWHRLYVILQNLDFFGQAWKDNEFEVKRYWSRIENDPSMRLVDAYKPLLDSFEKIPNKDNLIHASDLFLDTGHLAEAVTLKQALVDHYRNTGDVKKLAKCVRGLADSLLWSGNADEAMNLYEEHNSICVEMGDAHGHQRSLGSQAVINFRHGKLDEAIEMLTRQEAICRELNNIPGLVRCLNNRALVLNTRGEPEKAMELHKEVERYCRELGNPAILATNLGNQAIILWKRGELDRSMSLFREQERICTELGEPFGIQRSKGSQALILRDLGDLTSAMELHKEQELICRELGHLNGLQVSLGNQAEIHIRREELDKAMELCREGEGICRDGGYPDGLAYSLAHQAEILTKKGQHQEALPLAEEARRLVTEHGFTWLAREIEPKLEKAFSQSNQG